MKFSTIMQNIKKVFSDIPAKLKEIKSLPNFWTYIVLSVFLTLFFLVITFPYDVMLKNYLQKIADTVSTSASIGTIELGLINGITLDNISLYQKEGSEIELKDIKMDISLIRAIFGKTIKGDVSVNLLNYKGEKSSVKANIESNILLGFDSFDDYPKKGKVKLALKNLKISGVTIKDFTIPPLSFSTVNSDFFIQNSQIRLQNVSVNGPDLKGSISGTITLSKFAKYSQLDVLFEIDPSSAVLSNYKILLGNLSGEKNFKIKLKGSMTDPQIELPSN